MLKTFVFSLTSVLLVTALHAQTFKIKGRVKDSELNEPLPGASVYLKELHQQTITDNEGEYRFEHVPAGDYSILVNYTGFDSSTRLINTSKARKEENEDGEVEMNIFLRPKNLTLTEVQINRKRNNETDESSRYKEKNGDQIVNIVGAKAIEISPDITAANILQRVSGVSLERSNQGDGRYAIVRGMDQRYNNTLINGCKIPSPDPYNRYVPLDIIPSELLQKIEVYKSLTPDMEGDAIGGTVNLEMKDAPDELLLHANAFSGYSALLWKQPFQAFDRSIIHAQDPNESNPKGYVTQPSDFPRKNLDFAPKTFTPYYSGGLIVGRRFIHNKLGILLSGTYQNKYTTSNNQFFTVAPLLDGTPYLTEGFNRTYYDQTIRSGLNAKVDYQLNSKNNISFTNIYLNLKDIQSRFTSDTSLTTFRTGNLYGTGQVFLRDRSEYNNQSIESAILNGKHQITRNLFLNWTGLYSIATNKTPDQAEVSRDFLIDSAYHHSATYFDGLTRVWQHNNDKDYSGALDLEYKPFLLGRTFDFKAGGLYRRKSRSNYLNDFELRNANQTMKSVYTGIENADWLVYSHGIGDYGTNNYDASETVSAYYAQIKTNFGPLQVLAGFRIENTDDAYTTHAPASQNAANANVSYMDFLPNLQLKYAIDKKQNLRLALYKSLSRPSYFDLVPYDIKGDNYDQVGNPYLEHTQAANADLRYEWYPSNNEEILAGVFYKQLQHPIEATFDLKNIYAPTLTYTSDGTATNYGFELAVIKFIGHFGINANYTFTNSSLTTDKLFADTALGKEVLKSQNHPLQGQSKHIANLSLLYLNKKIGLNIEIAYQFTGKRISDVAPFYGTDYYQQDLSQLDFSADKNIGKHFGAFVKLNNLLNAPYVVKLTNGLLVEKNYFGRSFLFGFSYKLN
ncbi:MAG: TonB-dependent receptor [Bacteroidetes bacterium]|nr:TonB-dependent receptor [Bacteroidota bacterium]